MPATAAELREIADKHFTPGGQQSLADFLDAGDVEIAELYVYSYCHGCWREGDMDDDTFLEIIAILDIDEETMATVREEAIENMH